MNDQHNGFHQGDQGAPGRTPACDSIAPLLEDLHDGLLGAAERARVERHVTACPYCTDRLGRYAAVDRLVRAAPPPHVDGRLRAALYARIEDAELDRALVRRAGHAGYADPPEQPEPRWQPEANRPTQPAPEPRRGGGWNTGRPWLGGAAAAAVVLALTLVLTLIPRHLRGPAMGTVTSRPSATTQHTPASGALPAFADWRAAYLATDGAVHVVSLDGTTELTGPRLHGLTNDSIFAGMSPDGHHLAYVDAPKWGDLIVVDLRAGAGSSGVVTYPGKITSVSWSPDGSRLVGDATLDAGHGLYVFSATGGAPALVPRTQDTGELAYSILQGWFDDTHILAQVNMAAVGGAQGAVGGPSVAAHLAAPALAGVALAPRSSSPKVLAVVDVRTGQARAIYPGATGGLLGPVVTMVSPDNAIGILTNQACAGCTVQAGISRVTLATGQTAPLPNITAATNGQLAYATWQPGTHLLVTLGSSDVRDPNALLLLVDIDHDTVTTVGKGVYPIVWSPDGRTLVAGDLAALGSLVTEYPLYGIEPVSPSGRKITLTQHMQTFLGLVKTA